MPECDYCDAAFSDEDAYHEHLAAEHEGELGPIDRRKAANAGADDEGGLPTTPVVLGAVVLVALAVAGYTVYAAGDGGDREIGAAGSAHYHGTMEVVITGDRVDFSQPQYQVQDRRFHFEEGDGRQWHAHATGVTLAYGMETLDIEVTEDSVTYQGTTYTDSEGYNVTVAVNGDPVDPDEYVLQEGDHVRIVVEEA